MWDWKRERNQIFHNRTIQRCFLRAPPQNAYSESDEILVPRAIVDWYMESDDEQDTISIDTYAKIFLGDNRRVNEAF